MASKKDKGDDTDVVDTEGLDPDGPLTTEQSIALSKQRITATNAANAKATRGAVGGTTAAAPADSASTGGSGTSTPAGRIGNI